MKTIVDYFEYALNTIGEYCGGSDCIFCSHVMFCYVNVSLIAAEMMLRAGEYH